MMDEFYLKHDKPIFPEEIELKELQDPYFWQKIVSQIPPLIRKLGEYYHIPASKYPFKIDIVFDDERWESWNLTFGQRRRMGKIVGGTCFTKTNYIELNPYIYYFEGGQEFLNTIYHELAHWIIEQIDYLEEDVYKDKIRHYHLLDFFMVLNDICNVSAKKSWANYRFYKTIDKNDKDGKGHFVYMEHLQTIEKVSISNVCTGDREYYNGRYFLFDGEYWIGFNVDI